MIKKDVSCVIPCYNCEDHVKKTISSILNQTFATIEILLINDASTDNTLQILREIEKKHKDIIEVINLKENNGASYVRNYGVENAKGDYILFMDSDDTAEPTLIEKYQVRLKELNKDIEDKYILCYSSYIQIDENDKIISGISKGIQVEPEEILGYEFTRNYIMSTSGVLVKREKFFEIGGFNENLKYSEDWDLWLRLAEVGGFSYVDEPLVRLRRHRTNTSASINNMINGERKVLEQYGINYIREAIHKRKLGFEQNMTDFTSMLFRMGYWKEGFEELSKLIEKGYNFDNIYFYLGLYYLNKRELDKSLANFIRVINSKENHGAALNNIGGIYLLKREMRLAKEFLQKALMYFPNYIDANSNIKLINNNNISYEEIRFTYRELRSVLLQYND